MFIESGSTVIATIVLSDTTPDTHSGKDPENPKAAIIVNPLTSVQKAATRTHTGGVRSTAQLTLIGVIIVEADFGKFFMVVPVNIFFIDRGGLSGCR